jgi:hypothetical protein
MRRIRARSFPSCRKIVSQGWPGALLLTCIVITTPLLNAQTAGGGFNPERSAGASLSSPGPAVGEKIPFFRAPDQYGRMQDFSSLRGPNVAMIVFERSLDW